MAKKFSHNKKRNPGIACELLSRSVIEDLIENKMNRAKSGLGLMKKYFGKDGLLLNEYMLYNVANRITCNSRQTAEQAISMILKNSQDIDFHANDYKKSKLISEINRLYGTQFWSRSVSSYRFYASLSTLIKKKNEKQKLYEIMTLNCREYLVESIINREKEKPAETSNVKFDKLAYKIFLNKFNERYSGLSSTNKKLLFEYVISTQDNSGQEILAVIENRKKNIIKALDRQILLASDNLLKEKLEKVHKVFHDTDFSSEDGLILMMKYTALADELNTNE